MRDGSKVSAHNRTIESKKASKGSSKSPMKRSNNPDLKKYKTKEEAIYDLNVRKGGDYDEVVDYVNENW